MSKASRARFYWELWPDVKETLRALYRTFRGDADRARVVLGIVCEHAWRLEFEHSVKERREAERQRHTST